MKRDKCRTPCAVAVREGVIPEFVEKSDSPRATNLAMDMCATVCHIIVTWPLLALAIYAAWIVGIKYGTNSICAAEIMMGKKLTLK